MAEKDPDIVFASKAAYLQQGDPRPSGISSSHNWRDSVKHLLAHPEDVAHYTIKRGEQPDSIRNVITDAGKLEGVAKQLKISSNTSGTPEETRITYWIEPDNELPEETPEQEASVPADTRASHSQGAADTAS